MLAKILEILNENPPMQFGSGASGNWSFSDISITGEDGVKLIGTCTRGTVDLLVNCGVPSQSLLEGDALTRDFVAALGECIEIEEAAFEDDLERLEPAKLTATQVMAVCSTCGPTVSEIKSSKFDENAKQKILKVQCTKCGSKHRFKEP